jgi:hypothetical protein
VDRLDLIDSGRLLFGTDRRGPAVRPDRATLVRETAEFAVAGFDAEYLRRLRDPGALLASGVRPVTKAVLFPVRFLYTLRTGRIGRNDDAAGWYAGHCSCRSLVDAAMSWRRGGIADHGRAERLLGGELVDLYVQFFDAYRAALADSGEPTLAESLAGRHRRLTA